MQCVYAERIYTGKSVKKNAFLAFDDDTIIGVSTKQKGESIGEYAVVTPAFIDPHSHIGMIRAGEPGDEAEVNDHLDSIMALPDALDSIQMDDASFQDAIEMGVLYSCIMPGSGNIIGGRTAVIRHYAPNSTAALVARAGLKAAFGYNPMSTEKWKGARPTTRMGAVALLRNKLDEVAQKQDRRRRAKGGKKDEITFSAEELVLCDVLAGKTVLRVHVHKIDDIAVLLRVVDEFRLKVTVEHAMDVNRSDIFQELKKRNIPVVYGPLDSFAYKVELKNENWRNIAHLIGSGVEFGLMTDHPVIPARQLLLQTRWLARSGLTRQQCIEILTRLNAKILGIGNVLGTLEKSKWASFTCWNGDPFDMTRYPVAVFGEGKQLYSA
jgi:imidazolonepropionase-like amidohydrolase